MAIHWNLVRLGEVLLILTNNRKKVKPLQGGQGEVLLILTNNRKKVYFKA